MQLQVRAERLVDCIGRRLCMWFKWGKKQQREILSRSDGFRGSLWQGGLAVAYRRDCDRETEV